MYKILISNVSVEKNYFIEYLPETLPLPPKNSKIPTPLCTLILSTFLTINKYINK